MRILRRVWLAGAAVVATATLVVARPEFKNSVFPHVFGTLAAVLGLVPLAVVAAGAVDRRSRRRYGGAVLVVTGVVLVVWGARLASQGVFLRSLLETGAWRTLARSAQTLAPVGWIAAGMTLVVAGIAILLRHTGTLTAAAALSTLVAEGFAIVTAGSSVGYSSHFASATRFVDSRGITLAVLMGVAGLLPLVGLPLRHQLFPPTPEQPEQSAQPAQEAHQRGRRRITPAVAVVVACGLLAPVGIWGWSQYGHRLALAEVFPDHDLAACVAKALDQDGVSATVSSSQLRAVRSLTCNGDLSPDRDPQQPAEGRIAALTGLDRLPNLSTLTLSNNRVQDLTPLRSLRNLMAVRLTNNQIADLRPLAGLPRLSDLGLSGNAVNDLSPLTALSALRQLGLANNQIHGLSPLARLTALTELDLRSNRIQDVTPLAHLPQLDRLILDDNRISNPAPLAAIHSLTMLSLARNQIRDVTPLAACTALTELWLGENPIPDVTPLATMASLTGVDLQGVNALGLDTLRRRGIYVGTKPGAAATL